MNTEITTEVTAAEFDHEAWERAKPVLIEHYWSGETAHAGRHAEARVIWTAEALGVRFVCNVIAARHTRRPRRSKTIGLWERDVCEIF